MTSRRIVVEFASGNPLVIKISPRREPLTIRLNSLTVSVVAPSFGHKRDRQSATTFSGPGMCSTLNSQLPSIDLVRPCKMEVCQDPLIGTKTKLHLSSTPHKIANDSYSGVSQRC